MKTATFIVLFAILLTGCTTQTPGTPTTLPALQLPPAAQQIQDAQNALAFTQSIVSILEAGPTPVIPIADQPIVNLAITGLQAAIAQAQSQQGTGTQQAAVDKLNAALANLHQVLAAKTPATASLTVKVVPTPAPTK